MAWIGPYATEEDALAACGGSSTDESCGPEDPEACECGYVDWVWNEYTQAWDISDPNFHCEMGCSPHYPSACGMAVYGDYDGQIWTTCCVGAPMMMMSVVEPKERPPLNLEK